ncbi:hypothetical protein [Altererythrobacter sp. MF3-039]|uniref:hypothetical protein n=1 Tax=Altererythrobacter sp. MF3-039 TaxID=3252901 RepID=UPI00390C846B
MNTSSRIAALFYAVGAVASLILGSIYLFRTSFMPYHSIALGKSWGEVGEAERILIEALMDVAGAGWLALGCGVLALLWWPFRKGETWARLLIPFMLVLFYAPTLYATIKVLAGTPASPPWWGNALVLALAAAAFLLDRPWIARTQKVSD